MTEGGPREFGDGQLVERLLEVCNEHIRELNGTERELQGVVSRMPSAVEDKGYNYKLGMVDASRRLLSDIGGVLIRHAGTDAEADLQQFMGMLFAGPDEEA